MDSLADPVRPDVLRHSPRRVRGPPDRCRQSAPFTHRRPRPLLAGRGRPILTQRSQLRVVRRRAIPLLSLRSGSSALFPILFVKALQNHYLANLNTPPVESFLVGGIGGHPRISLIWSGVEFGQCREAPVAM